MASVQAVGQGGTGPTTDISEDDLYEVLANRRRRFAVHLLKRESEDSVEIGEMAERIAAWENEVEVAEITGSDRKRVYTALQQSHLPKVDDAGVVKFDKDRGTVEPTPALEGVDLYMDVVEGRDIPWSEYYLGLSGIAVALTAAVWAGAWPFTLLPDTAWTLAIAVAFAFSAATHYYYSGEMRVGDGDDPPELR